MRYYCGKALDEDKVVEIVEVKKEDAPKVLSLFAGESCLLGIVADNDFLLFSNGRDVSVSELTDIWKTQQ